MYIRREWREWWEYSPSLGNARRGEAWDVSSAVFDFVPDVKARLGAASDPEIETQGCSRADNLHGGS